jgi:hypothetical protein
MHQYTARRGDDGQHHVCTVYGRRIAGPFPSAAAAERHAAALNRDRWLLVLVERSERSRSPWDAYARFFRHTGDGRSAEQQLLDWWLALPDASYTRTRAQARVFDVTGREWSLLDAWGPDAVLEPRARDPEPPPRLAVWFAPDAIRAHFHGTDRAEQLQNLPDRPLAEATEAVLDASDPLWELFDTLCGEIVEEAANAAGRGDR